MKKLMLFVVAVIFLMSFASAAFEFDNIVSYEKDDRVAVYDNLFGLCSEIARVELITPKINNVIPGRDRRVMIFKVSNLQELYSDGMGSTEIINMWNGEEDDLDYHYEYAIYEDVERNLYENECRIIDGEEECFRKTVGKKTASEIVGWEKLNTNDLPSGSLTIALVTDVFVGDYYDGVPTLFGKEISRWAVWQDGFNTGLVMYNNMSSENATIFAPQVTNANMTFDIGEVAFNQTNCLLNNCLHFNNSDTAKSNLMINGTIFNWMTIDSNRNATISLWVNFTDFNGSAASTRPQVINRGEQLDLEIIISGVNNISKLGQWGASTFNDVNNPLQTAGWIFYTLTRNHSTACLWVNASLSGCVLSGNKNITQDLFLGTDTSSGTHQFKGLMDDMGVWNITLTPQQIIDLYNNGTGVTYNQSNDISLLTTLGDPPDAIVTINSSQVFSANFSVSDQGNLTNGTLYVYNDDGTVLSRNETVLTGLFNFTNASVSDLPFNKSFTWNFFGCGENTTSFCTFASTNRTFTMDAFRENSQSFSAITAVGASETYEINISSGGTHSITAELIYNGTNQGNADKFGDDFQARFTKQIAIGLQFGGTNTTFYWEFKFANSSTNEFFNSTTQNQTVDDFTIDNCGVNTVLVLNYTIRDEESKLNLSVSPDVNISVDVDVLITSLTNLSITINNSFSINNTNPVQVCSKGGSLNTTNYSMNVVVQYSSIDRVKEFHNIQNFTLNNNTIPENIDLYDLLTVDSQEFTIGFKGLDFLPVADALIDVTRFYIGDGIFRSVEVPKTDVVGEALAHLVLSDVIYTFIVSKNGQVLGTFENFVAVCADQSTGDCVINLNAFTSGSQPTDFSSSGNLRFKTTFDEDTRTVTLVFNTIDGTSSFVELNVTKLDALGNNTACTQSVTSSSGTLSCIVPQGFGNTSLQVQVWKDGNFAGDSFFAILQDAADTFGGTGIVLVLLMIMSLALMALSSGVATIILAMIGFIMAAALNLVEGGSLFGTTSTIIFLLVGGGIIIWKISGRSSA